jgi:hypothetical protein
MKDRADKSMGIVTRIAEALARIKPTEPLRLAKLRSWWNVVCVYLQLDLKKAKTEGKQCHAKTMKSKRSW